MLQVCNIPNLKLIPMSEPSLLSLRAVCVYMNTQIKEQEITIFHSTKPLTTDL